MNSNSNAASTSGTLLHAALHHDERVGLAGFLERALEPLRIFLLVLELEAVDRHDLGADLEAALGVEQLLDALARARRDCGGCTSGRRSRFFSRSVRYSVASHDGHLTHSPSGTGVLRTPGVLLMRGGSSFCSQLIRQCPSMQWRRPASMPRGCVRSHRARAGSTRANAPRARRGFRRRPRARFPVMMRLPMTTASACAAIARALAASRMPKPTPTGSATWRRISASLRATSAGVEVARARDALQRDVVDIAARRASRCARCAHQASSARCRKIGAIRALAQQRGELRRLLRRIVDDEHAVDAGIACAIGERRARPSPRSGSRSPSARSASCMSRRGTSRRRSSTSLQADALRQRALGRALDHRTVGHRIGKRHAELDDVGAGVDERVA